MIGIVLIAIALSGAMQRRKNALASLTPEPEPTPTATPAPSATPLPGAAYDAFLAAIEAGGLRVTKSSTENTLYLRDSKLPGRMKLTCSLAGGNVYAFSLNFLIASAPTPTPSAKLNADLKQLIADKAGRELAARNESLQNMLRVLISAMCPNDPPSAAQFLIWYDGAIAARDAKNAYHDTCKKRTFTAQSTLEGGDTILRCTLIEE